MGIVEQAVADGIRQVGIADAGVPVLGHELTGDECGGTFAAILDDLDQVAALAVAQGLSTITRKCGFLNKLIEDEHRDRHVVIRAEGALRHPGQALAPAMAALDLFRVGCHGLTSVLFLLDSAEQPGVLAEKRAWRLGG